MLDTLRGSMRLAIRQLVRTPLFTITAAVTLAAAIGANTAIFSVVNGVLLRPLPFEDPDDLLGMWHTAPGLDFEILNQSPATYLTYRADMETLEDIAIWDNTALSVTGVQEPEQLSALLVTDGFLDLLRVSPALGRDFTPEDDAPGAPATVIISHAYWERAFGGDPGVLGRTLEANGRTREIIGVLPQGFRFLRWDADLLFPPQFDPAETFFGNFSYQAIGRLAPGATIERVGQEVQRLSRVAVERYPGPVSMSMYDQARFGAVIRPLKEDLVGDVRTVLWVLLGTVGMVLLIACANVANLFLVRAEGRVRDVALRTALGADRRSVAGQFLAESVALGLIGGAAGLGLAWAVLRVLVSMAPANLPRIDEIGLDPLVLVFTLGVSVLAGVLFGLFPLLRYGRPDLVSSLKEGGRGGGQGKDRHRARSVLVVAQVALALVLLVGSGLMIRSFQALRDVNPGFDDPEEVLTFHVNIPEGVIEDDAEAALAHEQILRNLRAIPGVESAGSSFSITMDGWDSNDALFVEDFPTEAGQIPPIRRFKWIQPGYFETMGNPVVAGRDFTWTDLHDRAPVAMITETLAREYWGEPRNALGRRVATLDVETGGAGELREIVGVVGDVHDDGVDEPATAIAYWPLAQNNWYEEGLSVSRSMGYAVRTAQPSLDGLLPQVQQAVWAVNPSLPLASVRTLDEILDRSLARTSFTLVMLAIAAGVALLLGAVGIYGVISYAVSQRTREIGVRMALGAQRSAVSGLVVREGLALAGIGVVVGLGGAVAMTRLMATLLFGVEPVDPVTYGSVSAALALVAAFASWLPAHRASRVDPAVTLREE